MDRYRVYMLVRARAREGGTGRGCSDGLTCGCGGQIAKGKSARDLTIYNTYNGMTN